MPQHDLKGLERIDVAFSDLIRHASPRVHDRYPYSLDIVNFDISLCWLKDARVIAKNALAPPNLFLYCIKDRSTLPQ